MPQRCFYSQGGRK